MGVARMGGPDCDVVHDHKFIRFGPNYLNLNVTLVRGIHEAVELDELSDHWNAGRTNIEPFSLSWRNPIFLQSFFA